MAEALAEWFPRVLQSVEPFVSAKDIDKGANWTVVLAKELEDTDFGVICLAPDNLQSPWLNYEAGAITKSVSSRVCPVLFKVEKSAVRAPLAQLQLTDINQDEFVLLMASMNKVAGEQLDSVALRETVKVWWPKLEERLAEIPAPEAAISSDENRSAEPAKPEVELTEMVEEVLSRVRSLDNRLRRVEKASHPVGYGDLLPSDKVGNWAKAYDALTLAMTAAGFKILRISDRSPEGGGLVVEVDSELPHPLPDVLLDEVPAIARAYDTRLQIAGLNRTAVWEPNGGTAEVPF